MDDKTHKKKRKREHSMSHTHSTEPLSEEHTQLLDSVGGHLNELTDSNQDTPQTNFDTAAKSTTKSSKKKSKVSECTEKSAVSVKECALEYLRLWDEEKRKWSFKKKTQFWLLQNMYRSSKVSKDLVFISYNYNDI